MAAQWAELQGTLESLRIIKPEQETNTKAQSQPTRREQIRGEHGAKGRQVNVA